MSSNSCDNRFKNSSKRSPYFQNQNIIFDILLIVINSILNTINSKLF